MERVFVYGLVLGLVAASFGAGYILASYMSPSESRGMTIVDDVGRRVTVPSEVDKIISLAPSNTEILFALGLGDKVVGVDDMSDYPEEARSKTIVGGYSGYDMELIVSLDPDLVLASGINPSQLVTNLEERSFSVVILNPETISGIFWDIQLVGEITGFGEKADELVAGLQDRMDSVTSLTLNESLERPNVYFEIDNQLWTYGPGSFGHDLITLAGGKNIAGDKTSPYVKLQDEFVVASNPDIIVTVFTPAEEIRSRAGWQDITAIVHNQIYVVDGDLVSRPGPRIIDGLEALAGIFHPELFP